MKTTRRSKWSGIPTFFILFAQVAGCAVTLDDAYDEGGAGGGRVIDADSGPVEVSGPDGLVVDRTLQAGKLVITGGADIAEPFTVSGDGPPGPGQVVVIDPDNPGQLRISQAAYDRHVAGVIAGAGGLQPGLALEGQRGTEGAHYVALTGLVYVWADASTWPIRPGDQLTTSALPGHAMRATEQGRAAGAILGKAMGSLPEGQGLVLVLVSLL